MGKIIQGDCLAVMRELPECSVDLIVTSPPYNKGFWSSNRNLNNGFKTKSRRIEYDSFSDCMDPVEYDMWQREVITECLRLLKPTGSLFYNHQPIQKLHQEVFPTYIYDFPLKQTIVWDRGGTPKLDKSYFLPNIEFIFWIQKSKKSRVKFNRKLSDFNSAVWRFSPLRGSDFPAPFPQALPVNCIKACTDEGDVVLDPFAGSGSTLEAAQSLNRDFIGIELSGGYVDKIKEKLCMRN